LEPRAMIAKITSKTVSNMNMTHKQSRIVQYLGVSFMKLLDHPTWAKECHNGETNQSFGESTISSMPIW
jgi:hypothetical protein